jgi:hypothetical protein
MAEVRAYDSMPPYVRLVNKLVRDGEGVAVIYGYEGGDFAYIDSQYSSIPGMIGGARVPVSALTKVEGDVKAHNPDPTEYELLGGTSGKPGSLKTPSAPVIEAVKGKGPYMFDCACGHRNSDHYKDGESSGCQKCDCPKFETHPKFSAEGSFEEEHGIGRDEDYGPDELILFADNTSEIYEQKTSIIKNLQRKIDKGQYNPDLAPKLWRYWIDEAARMYKKETGYQFPVEVRQMAANEVALREKEMMDSGEYSYMLGKEKASELNEAFASKEADLEDEEPVDEDLMEDAPSEEDIFIQDVGTLGAGTAAFQSGKQIAKLSNDDYDSFYAQIVSWMKSNNFYPTVWYTSDHGNVSVDSGFAEYMNKWHK